MKKENKKEKEKPFVICECRAKVYGNYSLESAKANLPAHKKSKKHKELMEILKRKQSEK